MEEVNKMTKTELFKLIGEKYPTRQFSLKQILKEMPQFNHSRKIHKLLEVLVGDGKVVLQENGKYKVSAMADPRHFAIAFCKNKNFKVPAVRVELALREAFGSCITDQRKAAKLASIAVRGNYSYAGAGCPRCGKAMENVYLSNGKSAVFCSNDRVCIPHKVA